MRHLKCVSLFLVGATIGLLSLNAPNASAGYPPCTNSEIERGECFASGSIGDNSVELEGSGSSGGSGGGSTAPAPPRQRPDNVHYMTDSERMQYFAEQKALAAAEGRTWREPFWATNAQDPTAPVAPITLADIASFRPVVGDSGMEPNGWMVTGLDTNFYSAATAHVVGGELLGIPASVRFTPRAWAFDYGDGSSTRTATGGGSWAALGLAEFDPTPTSHVYAAPGTFDIGVAVEFGAEYSLDGQTWIAIAGTLSVPVARFTATAGDATTVLVARDCRANPRGPGC